MRTISPPMAALLVAAALFASFAVAGESLTPESDKLRTELLAAIDEELKAPEEENPRLDYALRHIVRALKEMDHEAAESAYVSRLESQLERSADYLSEKTAQKLETYYETARTEFERLKETRLEEISTECAGILREAMSTPDVDELQTLMNRAERLVERSRSLVRGGSRSAQPYNVQLAVRDLLEFQRCKRQANWSGATRELRELRIKLSKLDEVATEEDVDTLLERLGQEIGLLSDKEYEAQLRQMADQILDDAHQDDLHALIERCGKYQQICSANSNSVMSSRWQALFGMATSVKKAVEQVREGVVPSLNPSSWHRSGTSASVVSIKEYFRLLEDYEVQVESSDGSTTTEPLFIDPEAVVARIDSLDALGDELPALELAIQMSRSSMSSGQGWSQLSPRLKRIADLSARLESGEAFVLSGRQGPGSHYLAQSYSSVQTPERFDSLIGKLTRELEEIMLRRIFPGTEISETETTTRKVNELLASFREAEDYASILKLANWVGLFGESRPLLPVDELTSVRAYVLGVRQMDELDQPRLATYYFQMAAKSPSEILPVALVRDRLKTLEKSSSEEFAQGTNDLFSEIKPAVTLGNDLRVPGVED